MDYKRIVRSKEMRYKILNALAWIPDKQMIKLQYFIKLGRWPNLKKPKRYTEKIQWYKLYYRNPLMQICADKYRVREYVASKGLGHILNELYGVYDSPEQIAWEELPERFVLKTNNSSGTNILVENKNEMKLEEISRQLSEWKKERSSRTGGREWAYDNIPFTITAEKYLTDQSNAYEGINDWKFLCYEGRVQYIVLDVDRFKNHKRNFYKRDGTYIDVSSDKQALGDSAVLPDELEKMISIAETLAQDFPVVRVDLYFLNKRDIYFGELTFYPWSGYVAFHPDSFDFELGMEWALEK